MACGGGGSATSAPDTTPPLFVSAAANSAGTQVLLTYNETLISTNLPSATSFSVAAGAGTIAVSGVSVNNGTVSLTLASALTTGQTSTVSYTAPAINTSTSNTALQDYAGNDAISVTTASVSTSGISAPTTPPVSINSAVATTNLNGEYVVTTGSRVTITDTQSRLGSMSSSTVTAGGTAGTTSMNIHNLSSGSYDVTLNSGPSGGLTTITFAGFSPAFVVKLRWQ